MEHTNTTPPATSETAVLRWAVLMRDGKGRGELLGTLYVARLEAEAAGRYWAGHSQHREQAEIVEIVVPVKGEAVKDGCDLLP